MNARSALIGLVVVCLSSLAGAAPPKPEKIPVAMGSWKGPGASTFKSALRQGLAKECVFVSAKKARVIIDGEVTEQGKGVLVKVIVKAAKNGEVVEQHDFPFARPKASRAQSDKMGKQVAEIARRAPAE